MALIEILHFPDPRLRKKAIPVDEVNDQVRQTVNDMLETMYHAPGIGLAATQVNIQQQIIVLDVSENKSEPVCLINPVITAKDGEEEMQEGCLSVPGIFETVRRAENISVQALDQQGSEFTLHADGLLAVCIQHEVDHLDGKLFVDYLSPLKMQRIKKKMLKAKKLDSVDKNESPHSANII